jgi:MFS family permease
MTVPIYVVAAILAVVSAYFSDKVGKRSPFIIGFLLMMIIGYSMYVFFFFFPIVIFTSYRKE